MVSAPSVDVNIPLLGWTHIGGPTIHLLVALRDDDEMLLKASDAADTDDLDAVIDVLAAGGPRSAPSFVGVHTGDVTRIVAHGTSWVEVETPLGRRILTPPSARVWLDTDLEGPIDIVRLRGGALPAEDAAAVSPAGTNAAPAVAPVEGTVPGSPVVGDPASLGAPAGGQPVAAPPAPGAGSSSPLPPPSVPVRPTGVSAGPRGWLSEPLEVAPVTSATSPVPAVPVDSGSPVAAAPATRMAFDDLPSWGDHRPTLAGMSPAPAVVPVDPEPDVPTSPDTGLTAPPEPAPEPAPEPERTPENSPQPTPEPGGALGGADVPQPVIPVEPGVGSDAAGAAGVDAPEAQAPTTAPTPVADAALEAGAGIPPASPVIAVPASDPAATNHAGSDHAESEHLEPEHSKPEHSGSGDGELDVVEHTLTAVPAPDGPRPSVPPAGPANPAAPDVSKAAPIVVKQDASGSLDPGYDHLFGRTVDRDAYLAKLVALGERDDEHADADEPVRVNPAIVVDPGLPGPDHGVTGGGHDGADPPALPRIGLTSDPASPTGGGLLISSVPWAGGQAPKASPVASDATPSAGLPTASSSGSGEPAGPADPPAGATPPIAPVAPAAAQAAPTAFVSVGPTVGGWPAARVPDAVRAPADAPPQPGVNTGSAAASLPVVPPFPGASHTLTSANDSPAAPVVQGPPSRPVQAEAQAAPPKAAPVIPAVRSTTPTHTQTDLTPVLTFYSGPLVTVGAAVSPTARGSRNPEAVSPSRTQTAPPPASNDPVINDPASSEPADAPTVDSPSPEHSEPPTSEPPTTQPATSKEVDEPATSKEVDEPARSDEVDDRTVDRSALLAHDNATGPSVLGVLCPSGHPNPPHSSRCRQCSREIPEQQPVSMPRPLLGFLRLSSGDVVTLDRGVILGRAPKPPPDLPAAARPHVVRVASPQKDVSRTHLEVVLDGWHVLVRDLDATNGTTVALPGRLPVRLRPDEPTLIEPGTRISLADEVELTFEVGR